MWLWRQNQAKTRLLMRIACATLAAHLCLMGILFLSYGTSAVRSFMVTTQKPLQGQRIVVLPLHKKIPHQKRTGSGASAARSGGKQKTTQIKASSTVQKTAPTKPASTKTNVPVAKTAAQKKEATKQAPKKTAVKKAKNIIKKKEPLKKTSPTKDDVKKQKTPALEKKPADEIKKPVKNEEKPVETPTPPAPDVAPVAPSTINPVDEPLAPNVEAVPAEDVLYMHQDEYDTFVMYEQIQQEVARCWCPPRGIAPGTSCTLTFYVDWQGKAGDCTLKPSAVLMFDTSARASLKDMVFPRSSYGKEITLTFMQEKHADL